MKQAHVSGGEDGEGECRAVNGEAALAADRVGLQHNAGPGWRALTSPTTAAAIKYSPPATIHEKIPS
jgi:hypothetical protein